MAPRAEGGCVLGGAGGSREVREFLPYRLETRVLPECPPVGDRLGRLSTGLHERPRGPGGAAARGRLADSAPGAGARAPVPASAPPHPPPPAAAAAAPAAGAGSVQRSSAWFLFYFSRGAPADPLFVHPQRAQVPRSSRPRGALAAAACGPRVPSPPHAKGDRGRAAPAEPTLWLLAPAPESFAFYGPGSVSLCNPQGFRFGGRGWTPFSGAVGGEAGTRRRAVAAPAAARDGACQRSAARPPGWRLCGGAARAREPLSAPPSPPPSPRPLARRTRARTRPRAARRRRNTNRRAGRARGEPDSETLLAPH